ncbi:hypothetical protein [Pseudomonas putida]|uniref:hypothetical protein n=1 Tax=Pseudomonas putida TaxID=303 RepID=UPI001A9DC287
MMAAPGKGSDLMVKLLPLMITAGLLGACSGSPPAEDPAHPPKGGCYQSQWQAETVPVINKRVGPEGLEKYDEEHQRQAPGCP